MNRQAIIDQLKEDEDFKSVAYWDVNGWRYGFGCTAPCEGATITYGEAEVLLGKRVDQAIQEFHEIFADQPMSDVRQGALVNMVFNLGKCGVLKFRKMIAAAKADNWNKAADEAKNSLWYKQTGNRAKRIVEEIRKG